MRTQTGFPGRALRIGSLLMLTGLLLSSCETVIDANLDTGPTLLSVDATLTDLPGPQTIRLSLTAPYFDSQVTPAATGATVSVTDNTGRTYAFTDPDNDGYYSWTPGSRDTLGRVGRTYQLSIAYKGETYRASTQMNRVPPIDSLVFRKQRLNPLSNTEGYQAEFYARDLAGAPDYYRIKYYRNGTLQNRPADLITSQDGSFRGTADTDGLQFIRPIRQSINPDSLFALNDVVRVELRSVSPAGFEFLQAVRTQLTNGGLFATPPASLPTNVLNTRSAGPVATGYFMASAIRTRTATVAAENIRTTP